MRFYTTEKLGPTQALTPEGFLIVTGVPLARTGHQLYSDKEVPIKGDSRGHVIVNRDEQEVFRPETVASINGKFVTLDHPDEDITTKNWRDLAVGYAVNPRRGTGILDNLLLGDLVITCPKAIEVIRNKQLREISLGYDSEYVEDGIGKGSQRNILVNHIALVKDGRCGPICRIGDSDTIKTRDYAPIIKPTRRPVHLYVHF